MFKYVLRECSKPNCSLQIFSNCDFFPLQIFQLRRTDKMVTKTSQPTRSVSMQCLSSTNEAFLSQKTDLIAELKMSKDIHGIRRMRVEKAKMEGSYDKEAFTATHFVEHVS